MQTTNTVVFWCRRSSVCARFDQCHLNAEIFHFQAPAICQSTSILILYKYHMKCSIFIQSHRKCIDVYQSRMHHQNWFGGNYCGRRVSTLLRGELFSRKKWWALEKLNRLNVLNEDFCCILTHIYKATRLTFTELFTFVWQSDFNDTRNVSRWCLYSNCMWCYQLKNWKISSKYKNQTQSGP